MLILGIAGTTQCDAGSIGQTMRIPKAPSETSWLERCHKSPVKCRMRPERCLNTDFRWFFELPVPVSDEGFSTATDARCHRSDIRERRFSSTAQAVSGHEGHHEVRRTATRESSCGLHGPPVAGNACRIGRLGFEPVRSKRRLLRSETICVAHRRRGQRRARQSSGPMARTSP